MFVDFWNFIGIIEFQFVYDVVYFLNQYFDQVLVVICVEGGYVDKFIGDGIMVIFGMQIGLEIGVW